MGELGRWLNLTPNELLWFADPRGLNSKLPPGPLAHYRYRWQAKSDGGARLIESPKQRLKAIQRYLLEQILNRIPPQEAAHGFRTGRSVRTFVEPHVGQRIVLRVDLKDFFATVTRARVWSIFLTAGYPESVAGLLAGLCTHPTPREVLKACPAGVGPQHLQRVRRLYEPPHLPQGAPTSPALANLAAFRLDCRLAGLAEAVNAGYTRYADDPVFSGGDDFARGIDRFYIRVCAIVLEEGFEVHTRKTRIMRPSVSQRAAGVVLNRHANFPRESFDRLKAILHNCVKDGPKTQNRSNLADFRAHLAGKVAYVEGLNPARGRKLRADFERIEWEPKSVG